MVIKMKKIIILISVVILLTTVFFCSQITVNHEIRFTAEAANCGSYHLPLSEEEYAHMEKLDVCFDAQFSKRFFGNAKVEGTVTYAEKTYKILECLPTEQGNYMLVIQNEAAPKERCTYLTIDLEFVHFYLMGGPLYFGPADSYETLIESLSAFGKPY